MSSVVLRLMLLAFGLIGFGGAGVALAVARQRWLSRAERDVGLLAVAGLLASFGALSAAAATGLWAVPAFGGVAVWAAYTLAGQHVGLFQVEVHPAPQFQDEPREAPK